MIDVIKAAKESGLDIYGLGTDAVKFIHALERFEKIVRVDERLHTDPRSSMSWQEGYAQGIETATRGFCEHLRQLHDSYALSSRPGGFAKRGES